MSTGTSNIETQGGDVDDHGRAAGHYDSGSFGHEEHHGLTDMQYVAVAAILAVITGLEVSLTYIDIGALFLPVLLVLMAIKFFTVVLYFMHLRFDNRLFTVLFYLGLSLAVFVYTGALLMFHFFSS